MSMMDPEQSLEEFLVQRGLGDAIAKLREEKIDSSTILIMPESDLIALFPKYGDRIAIADFCKNKVVSRKSSLIETLRAKIEKRGRGHIDVQEKRKKKTTRQVEIGWMVFENDKFRQVKAPQGGGTRKIQVEIESKCTDMIRNAIDLFFPMGMSSKGPVEGFSMQLLDFKGNLIDSDLTIKNIFEITALTKLRFYLGTTPIVEVPNMEIAPVLVSEVIIDTIRRVTAERSNSLPSPTSFYKDDPFEDALLEEPDVPHDNQIELDRLLAEVIAEGDENKYQDEEDMQVSNSQHIPSEVEEIVSQQIEGGNEAQNRIQMLVVHRGKVFEELMQSFMYSLSPNMSESLQIEVLMENGESEKASDFGGVFRDIITEFWGSFYDKCTLGTTVKVPYIRHDFGEVQWVAICKILIKGWNDQQYLPFHISQCFIKNMLEFKYDEEELLDDFMNFVSHSEKDLLQCALNNFSQVDSEELLTFFGEYDAKWLPNEENIRQLVLDIAHKEIIQKPSFVARCFQSVKHLLNNTMNQEMLKTVYSKFVPTSKNVLKCIKLSNEDRLNERVFDFLKKFIRELDDKMRAAFVRFCIGSDLINRNIEVAFIEKSGLARSPIGHTCNGLLELPSDYKSFVEFRDEFANLLKSNVWVMDMP